MDVRCYTAITGGYDEPREDILCFGDEHYNKFKRPRLNAKIFKILPSKFLDADVTIWVDGNIYLGEKSLKIAKEFLRGGADMAVWKHFARDCIYEEAESSKPRIKPKYWREINEQVKVYEEEGYPAHNGLGECNVMVRKDNEVMREFNRRWWVEITRYSVRDQISFPYVLWKMDPNPKVNFIDANVRVHDYFTYETHTKHDRRKK